MQKIAPCLWFDMNCGEAVKFYVSLFPNSKILQTQYYPTEIDFAPFKGMEGKIVTTIFELDGLTFQALDGGKTFKMDPSVSFFINFDPSREKNAQERLDAMWAKLSKGGTVLMPLQEYPFSKHYGWVQDRFGVSWQLILTDPDGEPRPNVVPALLFVNKVCGKAEEALKYYTSLFKNSQMGLIAHYPAGSEPDTENNVMFGEARLDDAWIAAMDSAHEHKFAFSEGISFAIDCADQAEVDYFWNKFVGGGGEESQCGWLKDKYGFSWQVVPKRLGELLSDPDKAKSNRVMQALLTMQKIDVAALEKAYLA
jgi:predicted 3-demethylubiquinone-9 3-methyltransferase (glyoxalase superfamily)